MKRSPIKKKRTKARPGRLKGMDMTELRSASWMERGSLCFYCKLPASEEAGELAHIRNKRMWGDNKENTAPAHKKCHTLFHAYGPTMRKPCPPKESNL